MHFNPSHTQQGQLFARLIAFFVKFIEAYINTWIISIGYRLHLNFNPFFHNHDDICVHRKISSFVIHFLLLIKSKCDLKEGKGGGGGGSMRVVKRRRDGVCWRQQQKFNSFKKFPITIASLSMLLLPFYGFVLHRCGVCVCVQGSTLRHNLFQAICSHFVSQLEMKDTHTHTTGRGNQTQETIV